MKKQRPSGDRTARTAGWFCYRREVLAGDWIAYELRGRLAHRQVWRLIMCPPDHGRSDIAGRLLEVRRGIKRTLFA